MTAISSHDNAGEIDRVVRRLTAEFCGNLTPDEVYRCVTDTAGGYAEARIDLFVPLLVERQARQRLRDKLQGTKSAEKASQRQNPSDESTEG
jgi:hypothetical protein